MTTTNNCNKKLYTPMPYGKPYVEYCNASAVGVFQGNPRCKRHLESDLAKQKNRQQKKEVLK